MDRIDNLSSLEWVALFAIVFIPSFLLLPGWFSHVFILFYFASAVVVAKKTGWHTQTRDLVYLLFVPTVLCVLVLINTDDDASWLNSLSQFYQQNLRHLFPGTNRTIERLINDGYQHRVIPIQGYTALAFILASVFSWRSIVGSLTPNPSNPMFTQPFELQSLASRHIPSISLLCFFLGMSLFFDYYNPSCKSKCSSVHRHSLHYALYTPLFYSVCYLFIGLWISTSRIYAARLKLFEQAQQHYPTA